MSNTASADPLVIYSISTESVHFQPTFFHKLVTLPPSPYQPSAPSASHLTKKKRPAPRQSLWSARF